MIPVEVSQKSSLSMYFINIELFGMIPVEVSYMGSIRCLVSNKKICLNKLCLFVWHPPVTVQDAQTQSLKRKGLLRRWIEQTGTHPVPEWSEEYIAHEVM